MQLKALLYRLLFLVLLSGGSVQISLQAQGLPPFQHVRLTGMGSVSTPLSGPSAIAQQPAALASLDGMTFSVSGAQYFWLPDIRTGNFSFGIPTNAGSFGLQVQYYGFESYNESTVGLAYARQLSEHFRIGGRFIYLHTRIPEYGSSGVFTFDLGLQYDLDKKWQFGAYIFNPLQLQRIDEEYYPIALRIGAARIFSDKVTLAAEAEKTLSYDTRYRVGLEYLPADQLRILIGVQSNPSTFSLGVGWQSRSGLAIDLIQQYHILLGVSPGISITYQAPAK